MVARLLFDKGIFYYVNAAKVLKKEYGAAVRFLICGKIETEGNLGVTSNQINRWQQDNIIEYLGTTRDIRPILTLADCVVLPSYREGTPKSLLEAAAMGIPIIATNVSGCRDVVRDGYNGYLCRLQSIKDLSDKMCELMSLPQKKRNEMGVNGRALVAKKFDQVFVFNKYLDYINKISEENKKKENTLN